MKRTLKAGISIALSATFVVAVFGQEILKDKSGLCANMDVVAYNAKLPMSHPANICATQKANGVSWTRWLSGGAAGSRFHYLDLLELLYRSHDTHNDNTSNSTGS